MEQQFLNLYRQRMSDLSRRAAAAMGQLPEDDLYWRPNEESNSIANLIFHLKGNLHERLIDPIGGKPYQRDRDAEFNDRERHGKERLIGVWTDLFAEVDRVVGEMKPGGLARTSRFREKDIPNLDTLFLTVVHAEEHVGQMLYIAKMRLGSGFGSLSIPHKKA